MKLLRYVVPGALVASTTLLAGCTLFNRGAVQEQPSSIEVQSDEGQGQINLNEGSVTFEGNDESGQSSFSFGGTELAEGWPQDLPTPDNTTLTFSGKSSETGETTYTATFSSTQSAEAALADLKSKFTSNGWTVEGEYNSTFDSTISAGFSAAKGEASGAVLIGSDSSSPGQIIITVSGTYSEV
ncbi:MAG: hypothetical protein V1895_00850 [Parcubacteria group bacterium]